MATSDWGDSCNYVCLCGHYSIDASYRFINFIYVVTALLLFRRYFFVAQNRVYDNNDVELKNNQEKLK